VKKFLFSAAAAAAVFLGEQAQAAQVVLDGSAVIGSTGNYSGFPADNIFDQQTGDVVDVFASTYWLNPDNGPANAYITVDLGANFWIGGFDLFNTHNSGFNDRGTGDFSIVGANAIAVDGANGFTLSGPLTVLASGHLTNSSDAIIAAQHFNSVTANVRYLQFRPTSVQTPFNTTGCCGTNVYGLNELRVFDAPAPTPGVPEPAAWALMLLGFGGVGAMIRARKAVALA
jgi:hypothetical protein